MPPNTISAFTPEIWSQESVSILRERIVAPALVRRDFQMDFAGPGEIVNTRKPAKMEAEDFDESTGVSVQAASATNIPIALNTHKHVTFALGDRESSRSIKNLIEEFLNPAMLAMANAIDRSVLGLYADIPTVIDVSSAGQWKSIANSARVRLNKQLAPAAGRYMILSDDDEGDVSNLDILSKVNESGTNVTLREGTVGRLKGFQVERASNVIGVGSPAMRHNIAHHPNAFTYVSRVLQPASGVAHGVMQTIATDPDAGLALRVTVSYNPNTLKTQVTVDLLYGVKTLDSDLAVVIRSAGDA